MTKKELVSKVDNLIEVTRDSLQLLWGNINKGQQKQIIKKKEIKDLFDRYGVKYDN